MFMNHDYAWSCIVPKPNICTNIYNKESEGTLMWNDEDLKIDWHTNTPIVSDKDEVGIKFKKLKTKF